MDDDQRVRDQLLQLLAGGNAHLPFEAAIADFPMDQINAFPANVNYTPWHLLEHIRIAQWDILEFIRNPEYKSPAWPAGYWPARDEMADETLWRYTIKAIRNDSVILATLVEDPTTDLYSDLPHAPGYSIFREILVVADHNAYHIGEFACLREVMSTWPTDRVE